MASYLQPDDGGFTESGPPVTLEAFAKMQERLNNMPTGTPPDYYLRFNEWFRSGFEMRGGQIVGWKDPGPGIDGK